MKTSNIQHPTSNIRSGIGIRRHWALDVGRWMSDVPRLLFFVILTGSLATSLHASEPLNSPVTTVPSTTMNAAAIADPVSIPPAKRPFSESELLELLTATLQNDYVKDKGELELRLTRPWTARNVPDEPLTIKVLDMPANGVTPTFILRFELHTATEVLGTWQSSVRARVWREIWVARSAVKRGELVADADLDRQRRDVLMMREPIADFSPGDPTIEMAEPLQSGSPLLSRSVKVRPVIRRGQSAHALVQDGPLSITMKVEALEDGVPGQTIRARNIQTRRDIRGKVLNEQTILLTL
jgi:flagella basal body P-ring formation protein FlgA